MRSGKQMQMENFPERGMYIIVSPTARKKFVVDSFKRSLDGLESSGVPRVPR